MKKSKTIKTLVLSLAIALGTVPAAGSCLMVYASDDIVQEDVLQIQDITETEETNQTEGNNPESDDSGIEPYTAENKTNPKN